MQIVIDIPEEIKAVIDKNGTNEIVSETLWQAVKKGTPLPKGHGRLIILSEDAVKREQTFLGSLCQSWISDVSLSNATVAIIEADVPKRRKGIPLEENDSGYNFENWIP